MQLLAIERKEWSKFFITSFMMMLTIYIYTILRGAKDTLIVSQLGAELISTIKLYGVLPSAVLLMLAYTKLLDIFSRVNLYHIMNISFIGFFAIFALYLYPNTNNIHPDLSKYIEELPYIKYLLIMLSYWSYSLFYILSELWGSVMLSLLFWQLANQITNITEAKRFYPLFGLLAQVGTILAGYLQSVFAKSNMQADWQGTLNSITTSVLVAGALLSLSLWYLSNYVVDKNLINGTSQNSKGSKKIKMGLVDSLKYILSSKYIGLIALLILCYGISINLVEGVWKKTLQITFTDPNDFGNFMGQMQIYTGIITIFSMFASSYLLRIISWKTAAILTPIMILITGLLFFLFIIFQHTFDAYIFGLGLTAIIISVYSGAMQNILSKATKYAFFDPTKEMAYIPLDNDLKAKGKAAADVIGGRLGKSGGAIIQQLMFILIPGSNLISLAPNIFVVFVVIMIVWIIAVFLLSKEFESKTK